MARVWWPAVPSRCASCPSWAWGSWPSAPVACSVPPPGETPCSWSASAAFTWFSVPSSRGNTVAEAGAGRRFRTKAQGAPPAERRPGARRANLAPESVIHHRLRLGIVSALAAADSLTFNELKALLKTTDGNLSVHCRKLEDVQHVVCTKTFEGRRPRTGARLGPRGHHALT